jgi:hypothetical protein
MPEGNGELYHRCPRRGTSGVSLALPGVADAPRSEKYDLACATMATEREMKVLVILVFALLAAATVLAYGHGGVTAGMSVVTRAARPTEPGMLLLSGSARIAAAGLVRRLRV